MQKCAIFYLLMSRSEGRPHQNQQAPKKAIQGILQLTRSGRGFVLHNLSAGALPKQDAKKQDIEVRKEDLHGALNGDEVEVHLTGLFPRPKGKITRVLKRAKTEFVATIKGNLAVPADLKFYAPILVGRGTHAEGDKVLVRLDSFDGEVAKGTVLETIGKAGEHRVEMNAIVLEHGFSTTFPADVMAEAKAIEAAHADTITKELAVRRDCRDLHVMTIDPVDAKDFDDALHVRTLDDGTYEVGVHIADASYYCRPGTAIDKEAQERGTSVYLVDATIPMLPHELSAGVASLKPNEDRLAFSGFFTLDKDGNVLKREFVKTVINSKKRFSYEEAQAVLDKQDGPYLQELNTLLGLARAMRTRREHEGAIDFGDNEVRFELDANGTPLRVIRKVRIDTNWLIEEFMLLCNREVSLYVSKLAEQVPEKNLIFLYRVHDGPKPERIEELATFVRAIGYEFGHKKQKGYTAKDIQKLLDDVEGKPEAHLIRTATLRSMAKAIYTTKNIGHFGLSFRYYTHFTSPIRRYPDMLAHRILESHLDGHPITRDEYTNLEKMCIEASEDEANAVNAERESIKYKQVEFMLPKVGQTFDAVISGVTEWGLYVEEEESAAEGLVRVNTIGDDFYNYVQKDYSLVGQRSKKKYALGDKVRVRLVAADLAARQLDFELVP